MFLKTTFARSHTIPQTKSNAVIEGAIIDKNVHTGDGVVITPEGARMTSDGDLVSAPARGEELGQVFDRGLCDAIEGLAGQERLVARHEDVGKGERAREDVFRNDPRREVLKEKRGFFLIDVQTKIGDLTGFERIDNGRVSISAPRPALMIVTPGFIARGRPGR